MSVRKRILSGIIALLMVVSLLPVSASADSECSEHSFGEWTVVSEADCTEVGVETRTCESCGETENRQTPALGHVYILGKCSRCGLEDASYIAPPELRITTASGHPKLSWDAVDGVYKYWLYRSTDGESYSYQGYTTKTSFTNTDYEVGKVYYYKVKADNSELDTLTADALDRTAAKLVAQARAWLGCKEADGSNKEIIDIYNGRKPLPRGYKLGYTEAWCAAFVSACAIKTGMADIIPQECGCGSMVRLFKQLDSWDESDARIPNPGDIIFFDWDDNGYGDNTGFPGHVGIVEKVVGSTVMVIDGNNKDDAVGRRTIEINGRFIRGYGVPKYKPSPSSQVRSDYSNAVSVRAETSAPIVKITTSAGKPRIYWNSQGGMTKYWIYRSTDGVNFKYYDTTTKTSYTNASTDIGTTYYYKVKAVTAQKDRTVISDYSDIVSIQCRLAAPP